jgi:hypothetical protein
MFWPYLIYDAKKLMATRPALGVHPGLSDIGGAAPEDAF